MRYSIKVDVSDIVKMSHRFDSELASMHRNTMQAALNYLKVKLLAKIPNVFGNLAKNVDTFITVIQDGDTVTGYSGQLFVGKKTKTRGTQPEKYVGYLEDGTDKNLLVPYSPILRWVKRKFGIKSKSRAFASARGVIKKIRTSGTRSYGYFKSIHQQHGNQVVTMYRRSIQRFVNSINSGV